MADATVQADAGPGNRYDEARIPTRTLHHSRPHFQLQVVRAIPPFCPWNAGLIEHSTFLEVLWAFSIYLEAVAILPQLFMLQRTGEAETITAHYLFALGAYRALYIPNWVYRCVAFSSALVRSME